jgi:uncharacterized tellurite resistance protein B-like protein
LAEINRETFIYFVVVEKALEDNILTLDESDLLDIITENFNINQNTIDTVTAHFDGESKIEITPEQVQKFKAEANFDKDREVFKNVLIQALADEKITKDELEIIKSLRDLLDIGEETRAQIYQEVREEIERRFEEEHKDYMMERFQDWAG